MNAVLSPVDSGSMDTTAETTCHINAVASTYWVAEAGKTDTRLLGTGGNGCSEREETAVPFRFAKYQ